MWAELPTMHDARIFRKSGIYNKLTGSQISQDMHILGDCAYPLQLHLLTPYRDNDHFTESQKGYNIKHSSARSVIERAFSLLKGKFRRQIPRYVIRKINSCRHYGYLYFT